MLDDLLRRMSNHQPASLETDRRFPEAAVLLPITRSEAPELVLTLRAKGLSEDEVQRLAPHKVIPGNRPSNILVMNRIAPFELGALVALYEHKVFVQSAIWGINAFDQWGVELGKQQANDLAPAVSGAEAADSGDQSTDELIGWYRNHR